MSLHFSVDEIDDRWPDAEKRLAELVDGMRPDAEPTQYLGMALQMARSYQRLREVIWPGKPKWEPTDEVPQIDFYEAVVDSLRYPGTKEIELGRGLIKIEPCKVSEDDQRQALLFEPVTEPQPIGVLTGDPAGPHVPAEGSVLVILGSVESATVLLEQVKHCLDLMGKPLSESETLPSRETQNG
jgi:hypothetical protein